MGRTGVARNRLSTEAAGAPQPAFRSVVELDASGLLCPLPVLKARKRLSTLNPGDVLRLRADDPAAPLDVAHFCRERGHILLAERICNDGAREFDIQRGEIA